MHTPNRLIELDRDKKSDSKEVYMLQKVIEYGDKVEIFNMSVYDSCNENSEIYKEIERLRKIENQFCDSNKGFESHKCTYRIIKINMNAEEVYSVSDEHKNKHGWKVLKCTNCNKDIYYGNKILVQDNNVFCCNECLLEFNKVKEPSLFEGSEYDSLFID